MAAPRGLVYVAVVLLACVSGAVAHATEDGQSQFLKCNLQVFRQVGFNDGGLFKSTACDVKGYEKSLESDVLPAALVAILLIAFVCPIVFAGRQCFNCCGGNAAAPDYICCVEEYSVNPATAYSEQHIARAKRTTCLPFPVLIAGLTLCVLAGGFAIDAERIFWDAAKEMPESLERKTRSFDECMAERDPPLTGNVSGYAPEVFDRAEHAYEHASATVDDERDKVLSAKVIVKVLVTVAALVPICGLVAVGFAMCERNGSCVTFLACFFFFLSALSLWMVTVSWGGLIMVDDACHDFDERADVNMSMYGSFFAHECGADGEFKDVASQVAEVAAVAKKTDLELLSTCAMIRDGCQTGEFVCRRGSAFNCSVVTDSLREQMSYVVTRTQEVKVVAGCAEPTGCSIRSCVTKCATGSLSRTKATNILTGTSDSNQFERCNRAWGVSSCEVYLGDEVMGSKGPAFCDNGKKALKFFMIGYSLLALASAMFIPVLLHGSKAFLPAPAAGAYVHTQLADEDVWHSQNPHEAINAQSQNEMDIVAVT